MPLAGTWPRGFALTRFNHDYEHDDVAAMADDVAANADADDNDDVADASQIYLQGILRQPPTRKLTQFNY